MLSGAQASAQLGPGMVPSFHGKAKVAAEVLLDRVRVGSELGFELWVRCKALLPTLQRAGRVGSFSRCLYLAEVCMQPAPGCKRLRCGCGPAQTTWALWKGIKALFAKAKHPFAPLVASYVLSGAGSLEPPAALCQERCPWQRHLPARHILMASLGLAAFDTATGGCLLGTPRWAGSAVADLSLEVVGAGKRLLEAGFRLGLESV